MTAFCWPVHAKTRAGRCAWCGIFVAFSLLLPTHHSVNNATNWGSVTILAVDLLAVSIYDMELVD